VTYTVRYWTGERTVTRRGDSFDGLPRDGVLWVVGPDGTRVAGHDHYWIGDDGSVRTADHHDYDAGDDWTETLVEDLVLPDDRPVLHGAMAPDDVAAAEGLT
jgi:hypothetical protein